MPTHSPQGRKFQTRLESIVPSLKHRAEWLAQDAESLRWHHQGKLINQAKVQALQDNITKTCERFDLIPEFQPDPRGLVVKIYSLGYQFIVGM